MVLWLCDYVNEHIISFGVTLVILPIILVPAGSSSLHPVAAGPAQSSILLFCGFQYELIPPVPYSSLCQNCKILKRKQKSKSS